MAVYDFKCNVCGAVDTDVILSMNHEDADHPICCYGMTMNHHITKAPMMWMAETELEDGGFIADGIEGRPLITNRKQRRELMAEHDLLDANDFGAPPTHLDQEAENEKLQKDIDAITPTPELRERMKADGFGDIV